MNIARSDETAPTEPPITQPEGTEARSQSDSVPIVKPTRKKARLGFAAMSPEKQREIASLGGKAAHAKGKAHEFSPEEAREAGKKGGLSAARKNRSATRARSRT